MGGGKGQRGVEGGEGSVEGARKEGGRRAGRVEGERQSFQRLEEQRKGRTSGSGWKRKEGA